MPKEKKKHRRRKLLLLLCAVITVAAIAVSLFPVISRLMNLTAAQQRYDLAEVRENLDWLNGHSKWTENLPLVRDEIRDGEMWLRLNSGQTEGLEDELAKYQSDKYHFWLFLLQLQTGETNKAVATLGKIKGESRKELGQAMVYVFQANGKQASELLDNTPSGLNRHEQALWYLSQAQCDVLLDQLEAAGKAISAAVAIEPKNPNVEMLQLRIALAEGNLAQADQIAAHLQNGNCLGNNPEFLVQMGLLYLAENKEEDYTKMQAKLDALPQGGTYAAYLLGIQYLNEGQLVQGKAALELALESGLDGGLKTDALQAVSQAEERIAAETRISMVKNQ